MKISKTGELGLIESIRKKVGNKDGGIILGIGDDASVIESVKDKFTVITADSFVQNIHFKTEYTSFYQIGYKAAMATVSDLAAMASDPLYLLVCLGLKEDMEEDDILKIYDGIGQVCKRFNISIVGGDTVSSDTFFLSITAIGEVGKKLLRTRREASPGEAICVTGELGGAKAGLMMLTHASLKMYGKKDNLLLKRHLEPKARIKEAKMISEQGAKAMEDISDGLATEILHICEQSHCGAIIYEDRIPLLAGVSEIAVMCGKRPVDFGLYGGEDFELVFTAPKKKVAKIGSVLEDGFNINITEVGEIKEGDEILLKRKDGLVGLKKGYEHFKKG